jgi:glutamate/tyrosine decarboxylase-like PLP-dependent enzyme
MNSFKLWLTLKLHGRLAYEHHIDRQMALAASFAERIRASEHFELTAPMFVPILNFRLKSADDLTRRHLELIDRVTSDGDRWISETRVGDQSVLRMMVISYLTGEEQLADLWNALTAAASAMR